LVPPAFRDLGEGALVPVRELFRTKLAPSGV
jgi:hypothetical protein